MKLADRSIVASHLLHELTISEVSEAKAIDAIIDLAMSLANDLEINTCTLLDRAAITAKRTDAAP